MVDPLAPLLADGVIEEVISRLKSGKEAEIFIVQHAGEIVAAKVYKDRHAHNFRNNAAYKEGRQVRNTRTQRAMERGSRFGQEASEDAWKTMEVDALTRLHAAGVRVPQPIMFYEGVLLMELVIDADGHPAPRLIDAHVPRELAAPFYADLRSQVVRMLRCDLIHGDLSPYNVMLAWNGPTIIDFPQVIGAAHNRQAEFFLTRDLQTLHRFFADIDPSLRNHAWDAREIWRAYERGELTEDFVPSGKPPPEGERGRGPRREVRMGASSGGHSGPRHAGEPRGGATGGQRGGHREQGFNADASQKQRNPNSDRREQRDPNNRGGPRDPGFNRGAPRDPNPNRGAQRDPNLNRSGQRDPNFNRGDQRDPNVDRGGQRDPNFNRGGQRDPNLERGAQRDSNFNRGGQRDPNFNRGEPRNAPRDAGAREGRNPNFRRREPRDPNLSAGPRDGQFNRRDANGDRGGPRNGQGGNNGRGAPNDPRRGGGPQRGRSDRRGGPEISYVSRPASEQRSPPLNGNPSSNEE